jgi:hypothetical protein
MTRIKHWRWGDGLFARAFYNPSERSVSSSRPGDSKAQAFSLISRRETDVTFDELLSEIYPDGVIDLNREMERRAALLPDPDLDKWIKSIMEVDRGD